ncbi:MAG: MTAP family purine nucleoside phosphorylase, partial [Armatimonadetes bacterium]|nr:MTAP family purine nucleoside phosphorylase [Armatimonadota bacterium]
GAPPMVQHTDFSVPYCPIVRQALHGSIGFRDMYRQDGVLVGVTGPRYETPDEVRLFGAFGGDVVGMTGVPEAVAAREAGLCYAGLACVTNVGVGLSEGPIEHGQVTGAMQETVASLRDGIHDAVHSLSGVRPCTACR